MSIRTCPSTRRHAFFVADNGGCWFHPCCTLQALQSLWLFPAASAWGEDVQRNSSLLQAAHLLSPPSAPSAPSSLSLRLSLSRSPFLCFSSSGSLCRPALNTSRCRPGAWGHCGGGGGVQDSCGPAAPLAHELTAACGPVHPHRCVDRSMLTGVSTGNSSILRCCCKNLCRMHRGLQPRRWRLCSYHCGPGDWSHGAAGL